MRLIPGSGTFTVNGRTLEDYFPNKLHQQLINDPFKVLDLLGAYDVIAKITGGGPSGQAGALRLAIARSLNEIDRENNRADAEEGRLPHPRRARQRAQEGRSQEGPQGAAVLEALTAPSTGRSAMPRALRHRRCSRARQPRGHDRRARPGARPGERGRAQQRAPRRCPPRRGRVPSPCVARDPRISGEFISAAVARGPRQLGRRRARRRRHPDPRRGVPRRRHRRRLRRDDLRLAQPGARQRHQVLRRSAARSCPTRSRTASRPRWPSPSSRRSAATSAASAGSPTPKTATSCTSSTPCRTASTASTSCSTARTAPPPASRPRSSTTPARRSPLIGTDPDGVNINDGVGSTHLDHLAGAVLEHGADVGIAHDGDADRCLAVDADGKSSTATRSWRSSPSPMNERGALVDDTLVATVMSNLGLPAPWPTTASRCSDPRRRPLRARGARTSTATASAASSRAT